MTTDRETTRRVRSWLDEGVTRLPDRVLDAVLDQVPATRQRRAWWPIRRLFHANKAAAFAVATTAVVVALAFGIRLLPSVGSAVEGAAGDRTPAPSSTPMVLADAPDTGLAAGRYIVDRPFPVSITFDVPQGWINCTGGPLEQSVCGPANQGFSVLIIESVVRDPCDPSSAPQDLLVGPSVDDLVAAISGLRDFEATDAIDVVVDGFNGKEIEVTAPSATCQLLTWSTADRTNGVEQGEINLLRILDVGGVRVMLAAAHHPRLSADQVAELRAIMDSVRIAP